MDFIEVAIAQGGGTLAAHYVEIVRSGKINEDGFCGTIDLQMADTQVLMARIPQERYDEFVKIHGGTVAV